MIRQSDHPAITSTGQDHLPGNLAALWVADPTLAKLVEAELWNEPYAIEPSKAGPPTVAVPTPDGRRVYLHSRYQPVDEARRLVEGVPTEKSVVFIVHGLGLGYHVEALFEKASDEALLIVYESDLRLLRTCLECRDLRRLIRSRRLFIITDSDRAQLPIRLTAQQALVNLGTHCLEHPASVQLKPEFFAAARRSWEEFESWCRTSIQTLILNGRRTAENVARNIGWYAAAPSIDRLHRRHQGEPAIIVSAGPSLRKNVHLLKEAQGKCVIIAVQTTLRILLDMGIEPHYVTSLDYHDICTRFFENLPRNLGTELLAEVKASSKVLGLYPGPVSLLGNEFADKLLDADPAERARLRAGATVAHLAFYLAEYLGCDPISFIGQDLGFSDGMAYVPGTSYEDVWRPELGRFCTMEMRQWEHIARERPILRQIPDHLGRPMYTEERLFAYLQQFERDFASCPAQVIDASEGGAMKRGATPMPLREVLERFCQHQLPAVPEDHPGLQWSRLGQVIEALRQRDRDARAIADIGNQTLPLLEEVRDHLQDQGRVNRLIARIDALRARMLQHNDAYELATQLSQETELRRFKADRELAASKAVGIERQRRQIDRDILNVRAVIEAAGEFRALLSQVTESIESARGAKGKAA